MAPGKEAVPDFSAFINAEREKKKNQTLAQQIFGKNRRASAPGGDLSNKKPAIGGSLASRVGIQKRGTPSARASPRPSAGNVNAEWTHDLHSLNNPASKTSQAPPRGPRAGRNNNHTDRLRNALSNSASSPTLNSQFNIVGSSKPVVGMTIRGIATGPYLVVAKNLAPGTTAADIESAMAPMGGVVLSSVIIAERPKVIAEIVFETKEGADNVVDTFNNQNADGNILHVYHKAGPLSSAHKLNPQPNTSNSVVRSVTPLGPRADRPEENQRPSEYHRGGSDRYTPREHGNKRDRDNGREEVTDGSFGFDDRMDTDDNDNRGGLYSDSMISRGRGRGGGRDRGRSNGNDRGRGYR